MQDKQISPEAIAAYKQAQLDHNKREAARAQGPNQEQLDALVRFAARNGRSWKRELNYAWMSGNYADSRDIAHLLQQVRNQFGPSWLIKFKLPKAAPAVPAPAPVKPVTYKIVQTVAGRMIATCPSDIYAWAEANGRSTYHVTNLRLRPELQLQPRIQGLCGPMWDGEKDGVAVIRYEDQASNDLLSR